MKVAAAALTIRLSPEDSQYSRGLMNRGWRSTKVTFRTGGAVMVPSLSLVWGSASVRPGSAETVVDLVPELWQPLLTTTATTRAPIASHRDPRSVLRPSYQAESCHALPWASSSGDAPGATLNHIRRNRRPGTIIAVGEVRR